MSSMPADEDNYPSPLLSRTRNVSSVWRVVALAAAFILVASLISTLGQYIPADAILVFVGAKMVLSAWVHIPILLSLAGIIGSLATAIGLSLRKVPGPAGA